MIRQSAASKTQKNRAALGLRSRLTQWIEKYGSHPLSGPILFSYAFAATVIETIPVTFVLWLMVAMNRPRWKRFVFLSVLGSSLGSLVLAWVFHRWGYGLVVEYYPGLVKSSEWVSMESWISRFGMVAIAAVAAVPLPLTPAIALCGLMRMPLTLLFASVFVGKAVKYSFTAIVAYYAVNRVQQLTTGYTK